MEGQAVTEIADLAREAAKVDVVEIAEGTVRDTPVTLLAVPTGNGGVNLVSIKAHLDEWRTAPERIKGIAKTLTTDAFVALVNRHKSDASAIFANLDVNAPSLTGVVDYHGLGHEPAWATHRITYAFPLSDEWKLWKGQNGKGLSQVEFAAFIEDHIADLASAIDQEMSSYEALFKTKFATPSDLITMSRGMEVKVDSRVKEVRTLQSGEAEIIFAEEHNDARGKKLVVPGLFVIAIPFFVGGEKDRLLCRLRYRVLEGRLTWFFQMYRPEIVMREFLERALVDVGRRTGLPTFEASPEV